MGIDEYPGRNVKRQGKAGYGDSRANFAQSNGIPQFAHRGLYAGALLGHPVRQSDRPEDRALNPVEILSCSRSFYFFRVGNSATRSASAAAQVSSWHTKLPPANSCDSQFHVLGPLEKYPVRAGAAYQMPTATWEAALRVHKALGIERGIIVQTTTYGADHAVVLDALAAMGPNYRGCANALVFAEAKDGYLAKLHDAGV